MARPDARGLLAEMGVEDPRLDFAASGGGPGMVVSLDPTTGRALAGVRLDDAASYERAMGRVESAFRAWRQVPAPVRGQMVREVGDELRTHREALGALITLEVGKIRSEGVGEVQEVVDIADFAVGLSRQLYGKTMPSERPQHRMYEQWLPLGVVGVITAFNF
ncbi:MAG: aldehyde dehydrogenase family protein, partial [Phycisphaerales bacterium]|nr:aldehyde dehydrogenase family protein [Phycisphaerales bacterium]